MKWLIDTFFAVAETATENTFYAYPDVALSPNFYRWVFKFAGDIKIFSPDKAKSTLNEMAQKVIDKE